MNKLMIFGALAAVAGCCTFCEPEQEPNTLSEKEKAEGTYVPGSYIRGSFRDGARTRTPMKRAQTIIGIISMLLIVGMLLYIAKFYSLL